MSLAFGSWGEVEPESLAWKKNDWNVVREWRDFSLLNAALEGGDGESLERF